MSMNELLDRVEAIMNEHGYLTGQEFLDLTGNDMDLYNAYLAYWNAILIPQIKHNINERIKSLES